MFIHGTTYISTHLQAHLFAHHTRTYIPSVDTREQEHLVKRFLSHSGKGTFQSGISYQMPVQYFYMAINSFSQLCFSRCDEAPLISSGASSQSESISQNTRISAMQLRRRRSKQLSLILSDALIRHIALYCGLRRWTNLSTCKCIRMYIQPARHSVER